MEYPYTRKLWEKLEGGYLFPDSRLSWGVFLSWFQQNWNHKLTIVILIDAGFESVFIPWNKIYVIPVLWKLYPWVTGFYIITSTM